MKTREVNDNLYPAVVAGDESAIEQMINANQKLVLLQVNDYLRKHPRFRYLEDDLISEGKLGVLRAVKNMVRNPIDKPNPTALIRSHITCAFWDIVRRETKHDAEDLGPQVPVFDVSSCAAIDLLDEWQHYCRLCGIPWELITLTLEGYTLREVADKTGFHFTTVQHYLKQLRKHANT